MTALPHTVTIVCANVETSRDLTSYLERAGLEVRARDTMTAVGSRHAAPSVVVFFPDEFPFAEREVERLRHDSPHVLCVIVTKHPSQFANAANAVVIPKPAWGWTILDAIHKRSQD